MRKKHPEHANHERWLVSYADFITLLFAFFVIMYAISQADMAKFRQASASLKAAFDASGPYGMLDAGPQGGGGTVNQFEQHHVPGGRVLNMPAGKTNTAVDADPELREVKELLEDSISLELGVTDVSDLAQMQFDSRGLIVRIATKDFFDPNQSSVREDFRPLLDRIGRVVSKTRKLIRVEGHSERSEGDAWELSAARAAWVVRYWLKRFDMDPQRIGVAAYSHYRPITESSSIWGKASNRRVEIVILNTEYE